MAEIQAPVSFRGVRLESPRSIKRLLTREQLARISDELIRPSLP